MLANATSTEGMDIGVEEESPKLAASDLVVVKSNIAAEEGSPLCVMSNTLSLKMGCFGVEEVAGGILGWYMDA